LTVAGAFPARCASRKEAICALVSYFIHAAFCRRPEVRQPFCHRFLIPTEAAAGDFRSLCGQPLKRVISGCNEGDVLPVVLAIEFAEDLPDSLRLRGNRGLH
jgi:hypothetical protein